MRIFKRDSEVVVVKKIAEQVVRSFIKPGGKSPWNTDITKNAYPIGSGGGFGTGVTPPPVAMWFEAYGISGTPTSATYIRRDRLAARGGVHLYDVASLTHVQIRLNLANDPLFCFGL